MYERLLKAGAQPTPESMDGWMACVEDPDGNWIEVFRLPSASERRSERLVKARKPRRRPT